MRYLHWDITVYVSEVWSNKIIFILAFYYILIFLLPV